MDVEQGKPKRNKSLIKLVFNRDIGLCRCCGFRADQIHHIIPLIYGGKDEVTNMIAICDECHRYSPDTKKEFKEYMERGGSKLFRIVGQTILDQEQKNVSYSVYFPLIMNTIKILRNVDRVNAFEHYNLKKALEIEDINWNEDMNNEKDTSKL